MAHNTTDDDRRDIEKLGTTLQETPAPSQREPVRRPVSLNCDEACHQAGDAGVERVQEMARHLPAMAQLSGRLASTSSNSGSMT
jgi:hypothetical protein